MMTNHTDRFSRVLQSLPTPGGNGYHPAILGAANVGLSEGITPVDVASAIRAHTRPGRHVSEREITTAVTKAARETTVRRPVRRWRGSRPQPKQFDAAAFMARLMTEADGVGEADVWEASPVRLDGPPEQDAALLLRTLYAPDDTLFTGGCYDTAVRPVSELLRDAEQGKPVPPHVIPNPMTGDAGVTKDGKQSYRADSCVKAFRFAVIEFDDLSREDQLRFWWAINLPVCALIDSGGKSIHGWVRINDVHDGDGWTRFIEQELFGRFLIPMGCDGCCRNEARLSRMPGHYRAEKERWQRILYLAPDGRRVNP